MMAMVAIFRRELVGYFITPLAYVFLVVFLVVAGALTFYLGDFIDRGQADLVPFFQFHPWLYLLLIPAVAMRLWAEERRSGVVELLFTLPVTTAQAVIGKYLAAWTFVAIALALTCPIWITVNLLGSPDNGIIVASYVGSLLMAGAYLAIGSAMSALTRNQVIAFVLAVSVCFLMTLAGTQIVTGFLSPWLSDSIVATIGGFSFITHFNDIQRGVIELRNIVFFLSTIVLFLFANTLFLELHRD